MKGISEAALGRGLGFLLVFLFIITGGIGFNLAGDTSYGSTNLKKLTTDGQYIVEQESGNKVILRGLALTGGVWEHAFGTPEQVKYQTTEWDIKNVRSWGANAVIFYMDYNWFRTEAGYQHIEQIMTWCRKYDLYIIPQITVFPKGGHRGGPLFFESEAAKKQLRDFWKEFSRRYKHREEIAGYCIMDEPHTGPSSFTGTEFKTTLKKYMELLIDEIRKIDGITPIYIECVYGAPTDGFIEIDKNKQHIVYNIHFYEPMGYSAAGYPWIGNGGVPFDMNYPGEYITRIEHDHKDPNQMSSYPLIPGGTSDWSMYEVEAVVPRNGCNLAYMSLFSNGDHNAVIYFDDIWYSLDNQEMREIPNGSFEQAVDYDDSELLLWIRWNNDGKNGQALRTKEEAYRGNYSIKFLKCNNWVQYANIDFWISSAGAIPVKAGQKLKIRFWAKSKNAAARKNGIQIEWATAYREYLNKEKLSSLIKDYILDRRTRLQRPFFIGEFSPSLVSPRPGCLNYLKDTLECFNANELHWSFYLYRAGWGWKDPTRLFMGIYNGLEGVTTDKCLFKDQAIIDIIRRHL